MTNPLDVPMQSAAPQPLVSDSSRAARMAREIVKEPFRAATWRRTAYLALAVPFGIAGIPLALLGAPVGRWHAAMARVLLGVDVAQARARGPLVLAYTLLSVPVSLAGAITGCYFWLVVAINLGYPLRPGNDYSHAWGGPTLAGAWAFHAVAGGLVFLLLTPWVLRGFTALHARLLHGLLGADRTGLGRWIALALLTTAVCAVLSVPILHQL